MKAKGYQTVSWGLGWLVPSEDVSGQEVRDRATQGWA